MADSLSSKILRRIGKEVNALRAEPPEGIRIVVNEDDITDLKAWIQGPADTPYQNGYFRISIRFGPEYPSIPPNCIFSTKIFHPNVGPKGEICVNTLKKDWTSTQTLLDILTVIKCLLIYPNPESALDEEAGRLLLEKYEEYRLKAKLLTEIHARSRPAEFDQIDSSHHKNSNLCNFNDPKNDSKPTTLLPFATSNQVNNNSTITRSSSDDCDPLIKSAALLATNLNPTGGENQNTALINVKNTNTASNPNKDRRGRKRL